MKRTYVKPPVGRQNQESGLNERLETKLNDLNEKIDVLNATLKKENKMLHNQLKVILNIVTRSNSATNDPLGEGTEDTSVLVLRRFPLTNEDSIRKMDLDIASGDRDVYVETMKTILNPDGVLKSLRLIFSDEFISSFNIKGIHGKKSIEHYDNFYSALLDSISAEGTNFTREDLLRKAIQLYKKRLHKRRSLAKHNGEFETEMKWL